MNYSFVSSSKKINYIMDSITANINLCFEQKKKKKKRCHFSVCYTLNAKMPVLIPWFWFTYSKWSYYSFKYKSMEKIRQEIPFWVPKCFHAWNLGSKYLVPKQIFNNHFRHNMAPNLVFSSCCKKTCLYVMHPCAENLDTLRDSSGT